jgi:hypothetical protein
MNPSEVNTQANCPLFKLAAELRNKIYCLSFAAKTNDDGCIELNESTAAPSKALTMTCKLIRSETRAMYKAAYQDFPTHTFTLTVHNAVCPNLPFIPALSDDLFSRMRSFRLHWQRDASDEGNPLRFTSDLYRIEDGDWWAAQVELHDEHLYGTQPTDRIVKRHMCLGSIAMDAFSAACDGGPGEPLSGCLANAFAVAVCAGKCTRAECRLYGNSGP